MYSLTIGDRVWFWTHVAGQRQSIRQPGTIIEICHRIGLARVLLPNGQNVVKTIDKLRRLESR